MKIDPSTLLMSDLTEDEAILLQCLAYDISVKGGVSATFQNYLFNEWCKVCKFDESQKLLVVTTVFPVKAALSACLYCMELLHV